MTWDAFQILWLIVAGIVYVTGICMLRVLGVHHGQAVEVHRRILESRKMRRDYLQALRAKQMEMLSDDV